GPDIAVSAWSVEGSISSLTFTPDNQLLAIPGRGISQHPLSISCYNVQHGMTVRELAGPDTAGNTSSSDGRLLAGGGMDGIVRIWSMPEGQLIAELGGHTSYVSSIAFSPDGQMLASISDNGEVFLWDINTSTLIRTYNIEIGFDGSVSFNSDGRFLAAKGSHTWIWSVDDGQLLHQIPVGFARFSPG